MKALLLIIFSLFIGQRHTKAQTTAIPDANFEQELINQGIDSDGTVNGLLLNSDAASVISLLVDYSNITDLTGISAFVNLTTLYCTSNQITSLDLTGLINLTRLDCQFNQITNLYLTGLTNLGDLSCNNNQLTTLDLTGLTNLYRVTCINNQLSSINLSGLSNLTSLSCRNNQFSSLNLSGLTNLDGLFCGNNRLSDLNLSGLTNLTNLSCPNNQLSSINLSGLTNLTNLTCQANQLTSIDLSTLSNLTNLYCGENNLSHLNISNITTLAEVLCQNNQLYSINTSGAIGLTNFRCQNNRLYYLNLRDNIQLSNPNALGIAWLYGNFPNMVVCVHDSLAVSSNPFWSVDPGTIYTDQCPNTTVVGYVYADTSNNCQIDSLEPAISNSIIQIYNATDTSYAVSNEFGYYAADIDSGAYNLTIIPPNPYLSPCLSPLAVSVDSINDKDTVNWSLEITHACPYLSASIVAPFLRMTGGGSYYLVNYCNNGTAPAYGAYLEVELDTFLNVLSTSLPIASQVGNIYTFNLDTIEVGECGSFFVNIIVDTSAQIGQTHCSNVHIYPDSLCNNNWNGPIIQANGICNNDTVTFEIKNIGDPMLSPLNYSVIEDNLVLNTNPFTLGTNGITTIQVAAQFGKTYRIEAEQSPNFPAILGPYIAYANVRNCNNYINALGIPLLYYNGNPAPWIDTDCQANIAAYDPNDKAAQQIGYGSQHYIERGTPLDFKVRFQNTGNDTAFNVLILDTISAHLDLSTLQMKAASHDYTWEIVNGHTLLINFPNIKLVDSLTNEPLSHGFFRYEIQQKPNLPLETVINNRAAIYFDYNPPIFTNRTWHTIGENFIQIILEVDKIFSPHISIKAFPNPFEYTTTIKVEGEIFDHLELLITDVAGREVNVQQVQQQNQIQLHRDQLLQGVYFYQLIGDNKPIGSGKLLVK